MQAPYIDLLRVQLNSVLTDPRMQGFDNAEIIKNELMNTLSRINHFDRCYNLPDAE